MLITPDVTKACKDELDRGILLGVCVSGSHSYGLNNANSDKDFKGIWAADIYDIAGLKPPKPNLHFESEQDDDITLWEIGSLFRMLLGANPNVLEGLWGFGPGNESVYGTGIKILDRVWANRGLFLGSKPIRDSFLGFANGQASRFKTHPDNPKLVRHGVRMTIMGESLLRTGELRLRLNYDEIAKIAKLESSMDYDSFSKFVDECADTFDEAMKETPLPEKPDHDGAEALLRGIRKDLLRVSPPFYDI